MQKQSKIITLIGMSGSGKSYWSKKLEERGLRRICCDYEIEKKLAPVLKQHGFKGIQEVAKWLGHPYEPQFFENQAAYLQCEKEVMAETVKMLETGVAGNMVIDTTGSIIYTGGNICSTLKKYTAVVYLDTPLSVREQMLALYLKEPKPVVWGSHFNRKTGESEMQALARCYPKLLAWRSRQYKKYADITLDYYKLRAPDFCVESFLEYL